MGGSIIILRRVCLSNYGRYIFGIRRTVSSKIWFLHGQYCLSNVFEILRLWSFLNETKLLEIKLIIFLFKWNHNLFLELHVLYSNSLHEKSKARDKNIR